jgi:hypothetical protein
MEVRIKFSADMVVSGKDMEEVKSKFMKMPLFTKEALDCGVEFCEYELIEDADTYDDLSEEFNECTA